MKLFFITVLILSLNGLAYSQKTRSIAFYNVENLFDTIDGVNDDAEFLPNGKNQWNAAKYDEKINHINQVFSQLNNPLLIGMCEVENESVVRDVLSHSLTMRDYGVVHYDSPDARGIDVALIYDSSTLKLNWSGYLRFNLPGQNNPTTRDILWAQFIHKKDTIIGMVNHWPSRRSGQDESEQNRLKAASTARHFIDSLLALNSNYKIVFMGDLNDYPNDKAPKLIQEKLTPMIIASSGKFGGTHNYNNTWDIFDHVFVSHGFLNHKGMNIVPGSGRIHSFDFLLTEYKGNIVPFRTYGGTKYLGGYSDHLPVSVDVKMK
jgi:predicted extracellular nuclease